jgi:hypothetical protein
MFAFSVLYTPLFSVKHIFSLFIKVNPYTMACPIHYGLASIIASSLYKTQGIAIGSVIAFMGSCHFPVWVPIWLIAWMDASSSQSTIKITIPQLQKIHSWWLKRSLLMWYIVLAVGLVWRSFFYCAKRCPYVNQFRFSVHILKDIRWKKPTSHWMDEELIKKISNNVWDKAPNSSGGFG